MRKTLYILFFMVIITYSCKQLEHSNTTNNKSQNLDHHDLKWVALMVEGYQKINLNRSLDGAQKVFEATELMPSKNLENYLVSAMVFMHNNAQEKAIIAIEKAIKNGFKDPKLLQSVPEFVKLHQHEEWNKLINNATDNQSTYENSILNKSLLEELKELWDKDQKELAQYNERIASLGNNATYNDHEKLFEAVERRWEINKNKLDSIIEIYGWPGYKLVGNEGAKIAWGIPQHHPDVFFKRKCLLLMEKALENDDIDPNNYAKLHDRIARETWQKQTYGTSMKKQAPFPIKNPTYINERRLEIGLTEPIEVYTIYHGFQFEHPSQEDIQSTYNNAQNNYLKFEKFIQNKQIDSANVYISKAISAHGDINNEQLYEASKALAEVDNKSSQRKSMSILKVLIWRKWEDRDKILAQEEFKSLKGHNQWEEIQNLIARSKY